MRNLPSFVSYPGSISIARALAYGYMSGENNYRVNADGFQKACSLFGIDNPMPTVTRRLAAYGNAPELMSLIRNHVDLSTLNEVQDTSRFKPPEALTDENGEVIPQPTFAEPRKVDMNQLP